ncbi:MAG: hypothetical protein Q4C73_09785 [Eubacteriales bacterium]|nr:hypothetical protein [Eubacteriales bacterium]
MFKSVKKFICILAVLVTGISVTAFAEDAAIRYEGKAHNFVRDADGGELTDLFLNFKNVMPGDTLKQSIVLKNPSSNRFRARISLRSLGGTLEQEFLSQMKLKITAEDSSVLSEAASDQTAGLTDWVVLGTVKPGAETVINVELTVPLEMDNEFQKLTGNIQWEFKVEELSGGSGGDGGSGGGGGSSTSTGTVTPGGNNGPSTEVIEEFPGTIGEDIQTAISGFINPKTGDAANTIFWIALSAVSGIGLAVLAAAKRRGREK